MPDMSEGTAYPNPASTTNTAVAVLDAPAPTPPTHTDTEFDALVAAAKARIAAAEQLNAASAQKGRSWALPGRTPRLCWRSRTLWLTEVASALATDEGRSLCRRRHLSPRTALAVARACSRFADGATGRSLTAANTTIGALAAQLAGRTKAYSHDVVANARAVLSALGLAVEVAQGRYLTAEERLAAAAHHDGVQRRAASTWALVSARRWVEAVKKSSLPRRGSTGSKTPRSRWSPKRAHSARAPYGRSATTRTLPTHRTTAELVARTPALDNGVHLGALVDVVAEHVDCTRWSGRDLAWLLSDDTRNRRLTWPDRIDHPAAFLRHRLLALRSRLAEPSPSELARDRHDCIRAEQLARAKAQTTATPASPDHRKRCLESVRASLAARRNHATSQVRR